MRKQPFIVIATAILVVLSTPVWATVTLSNVSGLWSGANGFNPTYNTRTVSYGNTTENYFEAGAGGRSGLGFTGVAPPNLTFDIGDAFEIGQLRHFNQPTNSGTAASSATLTTYLTFSDPSGLNGSFGFSFQINNTPNTTGTSPADDDIVYFPSSYASETFVIAGQSYTINLLGFGNSADSLIPNFSSPEGGNNATILWGSIVTPPPPDGVIPAPGAFLLGTIGVSCVSWLKRRRSI